MDDSQPGSLELEIVQMSFGGLLSDDVGCRCFEHVSCLDRVGFTSAKLFYFMKILG